MTENDQKQRNTQRPTRDSDAEVERLRKMEEAWPRIKERARKQFEEFDAEIPDWAKPDGANELPPDATDTDTE